ncbi:hypothetical protein PR202_gb24449 [Eleusine coracana subsp. coracana]|uniref:Cation/H+ exchanger transmembrane domain-containing protein n=1 Tax=Eleusine coracana subsp. coracana TaxID=191504 RepID=A0AAV5FJ10_ELECO|nr:hypothetical protein PR202_gb24449 [Eleusine coracana subsp. coracana]
MGEPEPDDAVLFVGVSLVLGIASRHLLRGTRVPYTVALLILGVALGSLEMSGTDGVACWTGCHNINIFTWNSCKELGASKKLSTIIEGESLMNDGTAIVVYQLFLRMVLGRTFDAGSIIKFLSEVALGAVALGLAFGIVSVLWLGFIFNDTIIEISLTLAVSYIAFFTAQDSLEVSGVLTVMTLGMFYAAFAKTAFKGDSQESLHHFWYASARDSPLFNE